MADDTRSKPSGEGTPPPDTVRGGERGERMIAALGRMVRRFGRWVVRFAGESARAWRYLDFEQRAAGVGALLLIVSTFGPFSFVEAAIVLVALAVLLLLKKRADRRSFHLPFGDGAVIMAAGAWSAVLIVIRLFDRPLGQNLLALVCAAIMVLAGLRMRLRRPIDDLPQEREREKAAAQAPGVDISFARSGDTAETEALPRDREQTEKLPEPPPDQAPAVRRQTPAARRKPADPPTAVRPSKPPPPPPSERVDPDFDLPAPEEEPPPSDKEPPPSGPPASERSPFRARPADRPPRRDG